MKRRRSRMLRVALATVTLFAAVAMVRLSLPTAAFACSCAPPTRLVEYRDEPNIVIVTGTIAGLNARGGVFAIERVFKGPVPGPNMQIRGGDPAMCGVSLKLAARVFMVASVDAGVLHASGCSPFATLPSPEGDALVAEAEAAYGGVSPPGAPVEPTDPPTSPPAVGVDAALSIALIIAIGVAAAMFGTVFLIARRGHRAS